jgi:vitamin B12 transporter
LGSYSTAYITPSLFQLYDPLYGNEELTPEEDRTIEGGLEFTTENNLRVSAVYFNRNEKDYIDFVTIDPATFASQYRNIDGEFNSNGVEVELSKKFGKNLDFTANYTNTQAEERFALRIPEHKVNASLGFKASERLNLSTSFQFNSERTDSFYNSTTFASENVTLDSYSVIDFNLRMKLTNLLSVFGTVNNIFNTEFEELYRFQTKGRNVRIGFNVNI